MSRRQVEDYSERDLRVGDPDDHAAGPTAVAVSMRRGLERMGPLRTVRTLLELDQAEGFDCTSCAWPDPDPGHRAIAGFCENGAKAVAEEATKDRATPEFFAAHSVADLTMGLTQHRNGVTTIEELVNLGCAQGNIGKPGAGLFPVRGTPTSSSAPGSLWTVG
ncbi:hypothetical protein GCM10009836_52560 [Pseudonocardia ailaonensis]|uniref:Uncharacterized protein n=1 Tax=Pseudonocardia ailaonensis TaxID=367279 RepID=A0ABN2NFL2_9PSEU